ncbi:MAG TPA: 30S ribosomal protein S17 [Candidatus Cloacimonas sp.]|nr:30S ribosomal protein S17 [Candidatus Cloacimonas sp.]
MIKQGIVVSDKNDKTIVVSVERQFIHPLYKKTVRRHKKFMAHDENNSAREGDIVQIMESRPLSAQKRWTLHKIVERSK